MGAGKSGTGAAFPQSFTLRAESTVRGHDSYWEDGIIVTAKLTESRRRPGHVNGGYDLTYRFSVGKCSFVLAGEASYHSGLAGPAFTKAYVESRLRSELGAVRVKTNEQDWHNLCQRWDPRAWRRH